VDSHKNGIPIKLKVAIGLIVIGIFMTFNAVGKTTVSLVSHCVDTVMDGFEATAAIREKEKNTGQHVPVVALTAHAVKGYKEA
jgi:CheY-like chemotaxis protein